jgi:hypothetical protein
MNGRSQSAFGGDEGREKLKPLCHSLKGRISCRKLLGSIGTGIDLAAKDGRDQPGAVGEMAVKRADTNTRLLRNFPHWRIDPQFRKHRLGRFKQLPHVALRISADATRGSGIGFRLDWVAAQRKILAKWNMVPYMKRNIIPLTG